MLGLSKFLSIQISSKRKQMIKKLIPLGIVSICVFSILSFMPTTNILSTKANAKVPTNCLPGSVKSRLAQIRRKFGSIRIVSTHRPGARIAGSGKRSYHASCRAVDFHPPKGKHSAVVRWLKKNHKGGVGTYSCGMHHIHIDNGPRVRFHHCVNKHGSRHKRKRKKRHYSKRKHHKPTYSIGK